MVVGRWTWGLLANAGGVTWGGDGPVVEAGSSAARPSAAARSPAATGSSPCARTRPPRSRRRRRARSNGGTRPAPETAGRAVEVLQPVAEARAEASLEEARSSWSAGAAREPRGFAVDHALAALLGGVVGATGRRGRRLDPYARQIGQTGRSSSRRCPSGWASRAPSSTGWNESADAIVIVYRDPDAPIPGVAALLVVGDLFEVGRRSSSDCTPGAATDTPAGRAGVGRAEGQDDAAGGDHLAGPAVLVLVLLLAITARRMSSLIARTRDLEAFQRSVAGAPRSPSAPRSTRSCSSSTTSAAGGRSVSLARRLTPSRRAARLGAARARAPAAAPPGRRGRRPGGQLTARHAPPTSSSTGSTPCSRTAAAASSRRKPRSARGAEPAQRAGLGGGDRRPGRRPHAGRPPELAGRPRNRAGPGADPIGFDGPSPRTRPLPHPRCSGILEATPLGIWCGQLEGTMRCPNAQP